MAVVEAQRGAREHADVAQALARAMPAQVHDVHRGQVGQAALGVDAQGQVEVLEVEEVALVEAAHRVQRGGAEQHEAAADDGDVGAGRLFGQVAHLVARQARGEVAPQEGWREAAQQEVEQRRVALAHVLLVARAVRHRRAERHHLGVRGHERQAVGEGLGPQRHVRVEDQVAVGLRRADCQIVATPVADVAVALKQLYGDAPGLGAAARDQLGQRLFAGRVMDDVDAGAAQQLPVLRVVYGRQHGVEGQLQHRRVRAVHDDRDRQCRAGCGEGGRGLIHVREAQSSTRRSPNGVRTLRMPSGTSSSGMRRASKRSPLLRRDLPFWASASF